MPTRTPTQLAANPFAHIIHEAEVAGNAGRAVPLPYSGQPATDREVWIVTEEDGVQQVRFGWASGASEIIGWSDTYEAVRVFDLVGKGRRIVEAA